MTDSTSRYLRALTGGRGPAHVAAFVLAAALPPTASLRERRRAAARAVAAAAALLPCALARHGARRGGDLTAMWDVARKFGRPEDLDAPDIGVRAQLDAARLDPRLGGLLGDSAEAIAVAVADGTRVHAPDLAPAIAAVAPLVLGAVTRVANSAEGLAFVLTDFPAETLEALAGLATSAMPVGRVFRVVRSRAAHAGVLGWFVSRLRS